MISALILAAGQSKRMGRPKMLLPWGNSTVLEHVLTVFAEAGVEEIVVVSGGWREEVERAVTLYARQYPVRSVFNEAFEHGEMISSIQRGLLALGGENASDAALIGLGDQPQIQGRSVRLVTEAYLRTGSLLVAPSYQMRRGHPWLVAQPLWRKLLGMPISQTPRDFLSQHAGKIHYVDVATPDVLADLDTPEEYRAAQSNP